jgi:hypothetical protein
MPRRKNEAIRVSKRSLLAVSLAIIGIIAFIVLLPFLKWASHGRYMILLIIFLAIFITRRADSWKVGIEVFYLSAFLLAYTYNLFVSLAISFFAFYFVVKTKPSEGAGIVIHSIMVTILATTASVLSGHFGTSLSQTQFFWSTYISILIIIWLDAIVVFFSAPVPLPKNIITHSMGSFANYLIISKIGYPLFLYLLSLQ